LFESHRRLGVIYGNMGDLKRARAHLAAAVQINPTDPTPLADLATLEAAATAAEIAPSVYAKPTASGYFQLGQFWEQGGKPEQARAAYEAALKLDSNFAEAQRALAALHPASE